MTEEEIEKFKKSSKRKVRIIPTSMKNCFGLKQLHTYLQLPFLKLKVKKKKIFFLTLFRLKKRKNN